MRRETGAFAVAAVMAFTGCKDNDDLIGGLDGGLDAGAGDAGLTAATYNLGLLGSVGFVEQRAPLTIDAAAQLPSDLLCVQEVWEQRHWDALVNATKAQRPYTLHLDPSPGAMTSCSPEEFTPLGACAAQKCAQTADLTTCVTTNCGTEVAGLAASCTSCLLANVASGDLAAIQKACVEPAADAGVGGRAYVSGGSFGIGLLSARPLSATDSKVLDSSTVRRAILYAQVDDPSLGKLHVFCTHLTAIQNGIKYEGSYADWNAENAAHVQALIDWAQEKAGDGGQVLMLGDLNTGPAGTGIQPSVPESYAKLPAAGYSDPFLSGPNAACTFCTDNPLVPPTDSAANSTIDHILTRGISKPAGVTREFDTLVEIDVASVDAGGTTATGDGGVTNGKRQVGLSDHYGLRLSFGR